MHSMRTIHHTHTAYSSPKNYESISQQGIPDWSVSIDDSEDDVFCTFALRRTTIRKLNDHHGDHIFHKTKKIQLHNFNQSKNHSIKPTSIESKSLSIDGCTEKNTAYASPIKQSKKSVDTDVYEKDISVHFGDQFPLVSPRSVMIEEIFAMDTNYNYENIARLIFGESPSHCENKDVDACSKRNKFIQQLSFSVEENQNDEIAQLIEDANVTDEDNEGIIWHRILQDLKSIRCYHWKTAAAQHGKDSCSVFKEDDRSARILASSTCSIIPSIDISAESTSIIQSLHQVRHSSTPTKHQTWISKFHPDPLYTQPIILSKGSNMYSAASTAECKANSFAQEDITVVDTRPTCCTPIVPRVSIFFLRDEQRWTKDKYVATSFPYYSLYSMNENDNIIRNVSPMKQHFVDRETDMPKNVNRQKIRKYLWRLLGRCKGANKHRLQALLQ